MSAPRESETEAFARRLREIRDGSGRSYGALARRVGVSASTLHRYCSGSTVPMEFAPVERLARLCGCAADDVVELHRLWVRADADRRRRQENGAGAVDTPAGAPGSPAEAGSPGADASHRSADEPAAAAALVTHAVQGVGPGAVLLGAGSPPGVRRTTHLLRRRRTAFAAALVTTVVALVLLMAFDRSPLSPSDRQRTTAQQPGTGDTGTSLPPTDGSTPSGTASPDATETGPGDGVSGSVGKGKNDAHAKATKPPGGPKSADAGSGTPFTWSTDQHVWQNGCGHTYLVKRGPSAVPPPPTEADAEPWARSVGAVHGGDTGVRITVQGRSPQAVVLQGLNVRVAARRTPPQDNAYNMSPGCGGSITPRLFDVDLDTSRPVARSKAGNDAGETIPAVSFPYKVSAEDPEILLVTGRTVACDCDWYLELEWTSGDRSGTVRIDDHGRPFRTSGFKGRPVYDYDSGSHRWISAEAEAETESGTATASRAEEEPADVTAHAARD